MHLAISDPVMQRIQGKHKCQKEINSQISLSLPNSAFLAYRFLLLALGSHNGSSFCSRRKWLGGGSQCLWVERRRGPSEGLRWSRWGYFLFLTRCRDSRTGHWIMNGLTSTTHACLKPTRLSPLPIGIFQKLTIKT